MPEPQLLFNGINGATGQLLISTRDVDALARRISQSVRSRGAVASRHVLPDRRPRGTRLHVDPNDLGEAGWGIVYHPQESPSVQEALELLVTHRQGRVLEYAPGKTADEWLALHGVGPGPADPEKLPYHLLLVGDPERMPFDFQAELTQQYSVGRISFDAPDEYERYAGSVVEYESDQRLHGVRDAVFFGPVHEGDQATELSAGALVKPVTEELAARAVPMQTLVGPRATKAHLLDILHDNTWSLLFTAGHGVAFPNGDSRQAKSQGALLCQDWGGFGTIRESDYCGGADVDADVRVQGAIVFCFACFGAGTPRQDRYREKFDERPPDLAPRDFVADFPKRLLSCPNGGALAVIGHVGIALSYSFVWGGAGVQTAIFADLIQSLRTGSRVGVAMEPFDDRAMQIISQWSLRRDKAAAEGGVPEEELLAWYAAAEDARNYMIIGDPAVRLL